MEEYQPKISIAEMVIITPIFLIFDTIGILLIFVGLDDFFILDAVRFPLSQFYIFMKGLKGTTTLIGNLLETIPYIGALPNSTICWLITIYMDRNPKSLAAEAIQKAGAIAKPGLSKKPPLNKMTAKAPALSAQLASVKPLTGVPPTQ